MSTTYRRGALLSLVSGALLIGLTPILVRLAGTAPIASAFWRMLFAIGPLVVFWIWEGRDKQLPISDKHPVKGPLIGLLAAGTLLAGDLAVWHASILTTTVANATLLGNLAPVFVAIGARLFLGYRQPPRQIAGLLLATTGAGLLVSGSANSDSPDHILGDILAVLAAIFYAGYLLIIGQLRGQTTTSSAMLWTTVAATATLLAASALVGEQMLPAENSGWIALIMAGIFVQVGGQGLIIFSLAHVPATLAAVTLLLQPVVASVIAWALFGETLGSLSVLGVIIIISGILLTQYKR